MSGIAEETGIYTECLTDSLNVILNPERPASTTIHVTCFVGKKEIHPLNIAPGNPGHHLYYGLSVALKKSFFNLNIFTRGNTLMEGPPEKRKKRLNRIIAETCSSAAINSTGLNMEKDFFNDRDLKNLDSICQFLYNIVTPEQNQTVCLLEIDVWNQVNDLLEKLERYTKWAQDDDTYRLFRYFKFDIEQLQELAPPFQGLKSARKV